MTLGCDPLAQLSSNCIDECEVWLDNSAPLVSIYEKASTINEDGWAKSAHHKANLCADCVELMPKDDDLLVGDQAMVAWLDRKEW